MRIRVVYKPNRAERNELRDKGIVGLFQPYKYIFIDWEED